MSLRDTWLTWLLVWGHTSKSLLSPAFPTAQWELLGRTVWIARDK